MENDVLMKEAASILPSPPSASSSGAERRDKKPSREGHTDRGDFQHSSRNQM